MILERLSEQRPFFSICIPQYNRTSFLLVLLRSVQTQSFQDLEICISDGGSNDGRHAEIADFLQSSGLPFRYFRRTENLPFDANLRSSIALARGHYCLLCGNDDSLSGSNSLRVFAQKLQESSLPAVALSNYLEIPSGTVMRRVLETGILGSGPDTAAVNFRNFSFVSGIILARKEAQSIATVKWDGSEMYQTYLGCRILANGGRLLGINEVLIHKDVQIPGEVVDSYALKPKLRNCHLQERRLPLCLYGSVALDGSAGPLEQGRQQVYARRIFSQVLIFTYPPWLVEYRRLQCWTYALGVALGMRPTRILTGSPTTWATRIYLWLLFILGSLAGLCVPISLFHALRPCLHRIAKGSMRHWTAREQTPARIEAPVCR